MESPNEAQKGATMTKQELEAKFDLSREKSFTFSDAHRYIEGRDKTPSKNNKGILMAGYNMGHKRLKPTWIKMYEALRNAEDLIKIGQQIDSYSHYTWARKTVTDALTEAREFLGVKAPQNPTITTTK